MKYLPTSLAVVAFVLLAGPNLRGQDGREIELRAYFHDPVHPAGEFLLKNQADAMVPLELRDEGLSSPVKAWLLNDELILYLPDQSIAARARVAKNLKRAAILIVPAAARKTPKPGWSLVVVDDSPARFPWGTSRVVSTLGVNTAIQAGEHRLILRAGGITPLPPVKKVDEFNMAQTDFFYRKDENWIPFTERRMKYVGDIRRIFVIYSTPASRRPFVATITDYRPNQVP